MFKEKYKNAYDKIEGDKTQIAKILAAANNPAPAKKKFVFPFKFGTAFAALLVIGISIYSLPSMQDVNDPVENKTQKPAVHKVVQDASFGTYSDTSDEATTVVEDRTIPPTATTKQNVPQNSSQPVQNTPATEAQAEVGETDVDSVADGAESSVNTRSGGGAAYSVNTPPSVAAENEPSVFKSARSINLDIVSQYTIEFPETMGYASVTVYAQNESIAQAFLTQQGVLVADKSVIVSGDEIDRFAMVKLENGYAEVYAQNISENDFMDVIANISL